MNYFIYGARQAGKTTRAFELAKSLNAEKVAVACTLQAWSHLRNKYDFAYSHYGKGQLPDVLIMDDFHPSIWTHIPILIVACTPDNTPDKPDTWNYQMYKHAMNNNWNVERLLPFHTNVQQRAHFDPEHWLGNMFGHFYEAK